VAAALFVLTASFVVMRLGKKYRYLGTGWFWFLGAMIPVIGLVQVGGQSIADRYTYVPLIGMFIVVAWGAVQILQSLKFPRAVLFAAAGVILIASACQSRKQLNYWRDDETLLLHAAAVTKNNVVVHFMLGLDLVAADKPEEAIKHLREVLAITSNDKLAMYVHYELGIARERVGQPAEAEKEYREAVRINPGFFRAHYNLGMLLKRLGRREEAIEQFTITLRLKPEFSGAGEQLRELGVKPP
jgi:tetratricopeptide (TPR) repeat protein